ncbi:MAG: hypothetical protein HOM16_16290 [Woeseia sp.]|nr:hypothetical protein [Woeseia sp.]
MILGSKHIPAWQHSALQQIIDSDCAEIALVLVAEPNGRTGTDSKASEFLYRWFLQYEARKPRISPDAFALKDATTLLSNVSQITLSQTYRSEPIDNKTRFLNDLRGKNIDVLVSLADGQLAEGLMSMCPDGFWHFQHDYQDLNRNNHASAGFWEFITRKPCITSRLVVRQDNSKQAESAYLTCSRLDYLSHCRSRNEHFWKIAAIVPRVLRKLYNDGSQSFADAVQHKTSNEIRDVIQPTVRLSNAKVLLPLIGYFGWCFRQNLLRKVYTEKWHLMFGLHQDLHDLTNFHTLAPPKDKFWADPFIVRANGVFYLFIEEAELKTGVGYISVIEMDKCGNVKWPRVIIKRPYHLSYPFIFEFENHLYMIPESAENKTIEVYKCLEFPFKWEFDRHLMENVSAYDATLIEDGGVWWMFATVAELEGASSMDELCLFFADSPLSRNWTPHPMNPIVSDVRNARPAGALYRDGGKLYRPSQNSAHRYGYGLNINRVMELSKSAYREEITEEFKPDWDRSVKALHTYNRCGELTMIDAIRRSKKS